MMAPDKTRVELHLFVVMGGTGDLMGHKLLPALCRLVLKGELGTQPRILSVARDQALDDEGYRNWARQRLEEAGFDADALTAWDDSCLHYQSIGEARPEDYRALADRIEALEREHDLPGHRAFYLALPPQAFAAAIEGLGEAGLNTSVGWTRLVIEKPFGDDLASAQELNRLVHRYYDESQLYRIDHYLGKETVQNLLVFRFANPIFEALWNRHYVDNVQITVAEEVGIGTRARYYDRVGAVRDMIQNHLTQLLTLIAMEAPVAFEADAIRDEKVKVLHSIRAIDVDALVRGQYTHGVVRDEEVPGYREEPGAAFDSQTETYAALKLTVDNWRWYSVPFYLRTGKRLPKKLTQIAVVFREPPVCLFEPYEKCEIEQNVLLITIQPNEGFDLRFMVKEPGSPLTLRPHTLRFRYGEVFDGLPDAYETLLLDVLQGDQTLFVRSDEVEAAWRLYTPVLEAPSAVAVYQAGSWGPDEASELLEREGRRWQIP